MREVFELEGDGVGQQSRLVREKLMEYAGVTDVRAQVKGEDLLIVTVDYDERGSGEYDDSAAFIVEKYGGVRSAEARWVERPPTPAWATR